jgi:hypothetical protein
MHLSPKVCAWYEMTINPYPPQPPAFFYSNLCHKMFHLKLNRSAQYFASLKIINVTQFLNTFAKQTMPTCVQTGLCTIAYDTISAVLFDLCLSEICFMGSENVKGILHSSTISIWNSTMPKIVSLFFKYLTQ